MNKNIKADFLLESDPFDFFFVIEGGVLFFSDFMPAKFCPIASYFSGLRERADRCCWQ